MTYLALTYGSKGIFYFMYQSLPEGIGLVYKDGKLTLKYFEVKKINSEIKTLSSILLDLKSEGACNSRALSKQEINLINNNWQFDNNFDYFVFNH